METQEEKLVLIDTDAGTDDAMAIFTIIRAHQDPKQKLKIVGITCVDGNTGLDNVTVNVTRILQVAGASDIPIFRGAEEPLVFPREDYEPFHGLDGFGDHFERIEPKLEKEHGVLAIIRLVHQYKDKLTILALGPLTNLALAVRMDPSMKNCLKNIYLMGGNSEGVGNRSVCAEFNFHSDPEAANITLGSFKCPIIIVPWEVCLRQGTRTDTWRRDILGQLNTPPVNLLNKIESKILTNCQASGQWIPCDQLAAAALIEPKFIEKSGDYHCTVELSGKHTRGLMIVDYPNLIGQPNNVTIVTKINEELLEKILIWGVGGTFYK